MSSSAPQENYFWDHLTSFPSCWSEEKYQPHCLLQRNYWVTIAPSTIALSHHRIMIPSHHRNISPSLSVEKVWAVFPPGPHIFPPSRTKPGVAVERERGQEQLQLLVNWDNNDHGWGWLAGWTTHRSHLTGGQAGGGRVCQTDDWKITSLSNMIEFQQGQGSMTCELTDWASRRWNYYKNNPVWLGLSASS